MADLMLSGGDYSATIFGDIALADIGDDIIQSAINNIHCIYGEYPINTNLGNVAYRRRYKISDSNLRSIEKDCKDAILLGDERVSSVVSLVATKNDTIYGGINIDFVIQDIGGMNYSSRVTIKLM